MQSVENVSVGDFLIVVSDRYQQKDILPAGFEYRVVEEVGEIDPEPLRVVAVSSPIILCERTAEVGEGDFIDCRFQTFTKVSPEYVSEYCRLQRVKPPRGLNASASEEDREEAGETFGLCPVCLGKMSEMRHVNQFVKSEWVLFCKDCNKGLIEIG